MMIGGEWSIKRNGACVLFLTAIIFVSGCGKNIVGPSTPNTVSSQTIENTSSASVSTACVGKGKGFWTQAILQAYLLKFVSPKSLETASLVLSDQLISPEVRKTVYGVVSSRLFKIVVFRTGLGNLLVSKYLRILSECWYPGNNSSPKGYSPEITLLPYKWLHARGFYGDLQTGWGNGHGYHLESYTPAGDYTLVETYSSPGNLYHNETNFNNFLWRINVFPSTGNYAQISFGLGSVQGLLQLDSYSNMREVNGSQIDFNDVWASLTDKSGRCYFASNDGTLEMNLNFIADGSGSGFLKIPNPCGKVVRYEFVQNANGHGYWSVDGGKKHYF